MKDAKPLTQEGLEFWKEMIEPAKPETKPTNTPLVWRVMCEHCRWREDDLDTRNDALRLGRNHIHEAHPDEDWEFRVQGLRY